MPNVDGLMRIANHAVVSGSSWTSASPLLRKLSTSDSLPGFASNRTSNATVTMMISFFYRTTCVRTKELTCGKHKTLTIRLTRFAEGVRPFAAGAVCATAADLLKWQIALDTGRVLNASSLELARTHTMLGLPERKTLRDLPVPQEELAALVGFYDSDEGSVENFAGPEDQDAKLHYRLPGTKIEGVMLRQAPNIYAVNANTEVHFLLRSGNPTWAIVYTGGLMMD